MNTQIETQNPIMQPIQYNGQVFITSQRLHADYRNNNGGKYRQLKDFNRLIRSIEAYQSYLDNGDIVELTWQEVKATGAEFAPVFESISYKPIMLINATMQLAISHHLDDAISKAISVTVNEQAANPKDKTDTKYITQVMKDMLTIAKLCGLQGNQAILSANRATRKLTGHAPLELIDVDLIASVKERTITPTEIGIRLGGLSAVKVNQMLSEIGYQDSTRDHKDHLVWNPTEKGKPFGEMLDTGKKYSDGTPVKQWKWFETVVNQLKITETL